MSLADIFSFENPYLSFIKKTNNNCILGISKSFDLIELTKGGIVFVKGKVVKQIKELPLKTNGKGYRWNGVSLFSKSLITDLDRFLKSHPGNSPEGDFFEFWRKRGNSVTVEKCSDFINVNTPQDLFFATLYNYAFCTGNRAVKRMANQLRRQFLRI